MGPTQSDDWTITADCLVSSAANFPAGLENCSRNWKARERIMPSHMRLSAVLALLCCGPGVSLYQGVLDRAEAQALAPALGGQVSSAEEGPMEGVLVSAQQNGSSISTTVVSGADGRFSFPRHNLPAGHYVLRMRAVGYELDAPKSVDVGPLQTASVDLKLRRTMDLAAQLTNTEWFMSMPGTAEEKRPLIECMSCHTLERIVRSTLVPSNLCRC
jgi:hypothetical protein